MQSRDFVYKSKNNFLRNENKENSLRTSQVFNKQKNVQFRLKKYDMNYEYIGGVYKP